MSRACPPAPPRSAPPEADSPVVATSTANRRLATILVADVDGYSLMRADEERTLIDLRAHIAELQRGMVERNAGGAV